MPDKYTKKHEHVRIGGHLHRVTIFRDDVGNLVHRVVEPVMHEFYPRDVVQTIVGATLLAVPLSFTEELWALGQEISLTSAAILVVTSLFFIATFVYYQVYRGTRHENWARFRERGHLKQLLRRVVSTYVVAFLLSAIMLTLIDRAPWGIDFVVAIKRTVLMAFPASLSAAVVDMLK